MYPKQPGVFIAQFFTFTRISKAIGAIKPPSFLHGKTLHGRGTDCPPMGIYKNPSNSAPKLRYPGGYPLNNDGTGR